MDKLLELYPPKSLYIKAYSLIIKKSIGSIEPIIETYFGFPKLFPHSTKIFPSFMVQSKILLSFVE